MEKSYGKIGLRGKNTSYVSKTSFMPQRTVEEIEEEKRVEAIVGKVGLMGSFGIIGISEKEMRKLHNYKYDDPVKLWMLWNSWRIPLEKDKKTFYSE